jgi:predicted nicotinamide N-methyase
MTSLRIKYQTLEMGGFDIHLRTLRDNQQFEDPEGEAAALGISSANWPLFGVVWESSKVLARHMLDYDVAEKRILEVGCGIALASLVLNERQSDITATDVHPEAGGYLQHNVALNKGRAIPFTRTDWLDDATDLGLFDLIIGSDLLYEHAHAEMLSGFIEAHANPACEVVIVDPGRGNHARFSTMMGTHGFSVHRQKPEGEAAPAFSGVILAYSRLEGSNGYRQVNSSTPRGTGHRS